MLALYRAGRQADALEAFQEARSVLRDELGLDPSPALQRLEHQILNQDPELAAPDAFAPARHPAATTKPSGIVTFLLTEAEAPSTQARANGRRSTRRVRRCRRTATPCSSPFPARETRWQLRSVVNVRREASARLRIGITSAEAIATDEGYTGTGRPRCGEHLECRAPGADPSFTGRRATFSEKRRSTRPRCSTWASTV